jgi:radical SAM protein with 4Fe4S-binding SPASM domain
MFTLSNDQLNLASKITVTRFYNACKVYLSFWIEKITKKGNIKGFPISLTIEPTTACNLGCPECPSGLKQFSRPEGNLKNPFYESIINQVEKHVFYLNFYFQGEPFINPNFLDMVAYANSKKIYTATSTNAHFLTDEVAKKTIQSGLDRLIISIDGITQEVYENYRVHGKLEKVLDGTKNILKWKKELQSKTPYVIFQFLVVKPNEHQIEDAKKLANELGVDEIRFKTAQVYEYENGNPLLPTVEKYSRYKKQANGKYALKNKLLNECWRMWSSCVITWDGKVVPCCFDKDATHQLGDLSTSNFNQLWKSEVYQKFRKNILTNRQSIDICKNCTEGTKVFENT